jgi:cytoskeletal protein CcmA (bactofilin family)
MSMPLFRDKSKLPYGQDAKPPFSREPASLPISTLGVATMVTGVLDTGGELTIHGSVLGRINAERLVLGARGYVEGDIVAKDVHIGGRLNGRVFALNVTLDDTADVSGRIFHNTVTVAPGARFEGRMPWRPASYFEALDQLPETRA